MLMETSGIGACQSNLSMVCCRFSRIYGFRRGSARFASAEG
ncbi:hypothetical protein BN1864_LIB5394:00832 [Pseudomonas sp. 1 R 17]|nr:hypothetical protein BN1864_LIB5394:00832 [Pseudomonas sp. 1 R 17]